MTNNATAANAKPKGLWEVIINIDLIKYALEREKDNIAYLIRNPNPFANLNITKPKSFADRFFQAAEVIDGLDETTTSKNSARTNNLPRKTKYGILDYFPGVPIHIILTAIPLIPLFALSIVVGILSVVRFLLKEASDIPIVSIFASIAEALVGIMIDIITEFAVAAYRITRYIAQPLNRFIQQALIPILGIMTTIAVLPIIAAVHLIMPGKTPAIDAPADDKAPKSTSGIQVKLGSPEHTVTAPKIHAPLSFSILNRQTKKSDTTDQASSNQNTKGYIFDSIHTVTRYGAIEDGSKITQKGKATLILDCEIGENVKVEIAGTGNVIFTKQPPESLTVLCTGTGQALVQERWSPQP